jgi:CubicO group peptidase (beta-lactamase class C family)
MSLRPSPALCSALLGAAALTVLPSIAAAQRSRVASPLDGLDAYVAQAVRDWNVPGLAIAVVKDDSVVFARGYGVRTLGTGDSVTAHTLFANASTTKAFTAMAVALMVDSGVVRWDDPVVRWVPGFVLRDPYVTQEARVRDLLTHRVGFGDPGYLWYGTSADLVAIIRRLRYVTPESSFRSHFAYNNVSYATAGVIAGLAAGMSWDDLVRTRILQPLGMSETVTQAQGLAGRVDVATPHDLIADTLRAIGRFGVGLVDPIAPAGAMYSSVLDMTRWIRFLLDSGRVGGRRLVSEASFRELFRPQTIVEPDQFYPTARLTRPRFTAYGLGWFLEDYRGEFVAFHTGSIDGTVAIVGLIPDRRLGLVIFANRDHAELRHALMYRVFDAYLGGLRRDWSAEMRVMYDSLREAGLARRREAEAKRVAGTHPSLPLERYAGTYTDSLFGDVTLRFENGALVAEASPFLVADLEHWHYDVFALRFHNRWLPPALATFHIGADGAVSEVVIDGALRRRAPDAPQR